MGKAIMPPVSLKKYGRISSRPVALFCFKVLMSVKTSCGDVVCKKIEERQGCFK